MKYLPSQPTIPVAVVLFLLSGLSEGWESPLYRQGWDPGETPFAITRGTPVFPGALNVSRKMIQDFSYAGYHRSEKVIPRKTGPLFDVTAAPFHAAGNGIADDTDAIQQALDEAGESGGGVVYLPPGTYRLTIPSNREFALVINHNDIVLRGAGPDKTFLFNDTVEMHRKDILRVTAPGSENLEGDWQTIRSSASETSIPADLVYFRKTVPVAKTEGFSVGDWIVIRSKLTDEFLREHFIHTIWGEWKEDIGDLVYFRQIEAIDEAAKVITVDVPIRYYMLARDEPRLYHAPPHTEEVGLEDFSIGNREHPLWNDRDSLIDDAHKLDENSSGFHAHKSAAIRYHLARNCWMKRVQSYRPPGNEGDFHLLSKGVRLSASARITLRDCHFQRPMYMGSGGNGYMFQILGQENLLMDCSARFARHPFMFSSFHCSGNVILRGAAEEGGFRESSGKGSDHHAYLSQANLVDGTSVIRDFFKASYRSGGGPPIHGTSAVNSVYWNLRGLHYFSGRTYIVQSQQSRFGYIIGTRGYATRAWNNNTSGGDILYPLDHLEGVGQGDTLHPPSLFTDQLSKRTENDYPVVRIDQFELYREVEAGDHLKIRATAQDADHGIERLQLFIDGHRMIDLAETGELVFDWNEIPAGNHSVLAVATDKKGASSTRGFFVKATDRSPQIHYTFDASESKLVAEDISGNNRHGRFRHNARRTVGRIGKGLYIPNDASYLDLPEGTYGSEAGTVALAFKTNGEFDEEGFLFYGSDTVAGNGYGGKDEFHVSVDEGGFLHFFLRGDELGQEIEWVGDVGGFTDDQWHHVAICWDVEDELILYADGVERLRVPHLANPFQFKGTVNLGRPYWDFDLKTYFFGAIDDFMLFDYPLSAEEVSGLAAGLLDFDSWSAIHHLESGDATADDDGDGISNLLEFALGLDPAGQTDHRFLPHRDESGFFVYRRNTLAKDLSFAVEVSTDLKTWTSGSRTGNLTSFRPVGPGVEEVTIQPTEPGDERVFMRLRVGR